MGLSQGAWVVSLAAARSKAPSFLVMVSASVSSVAEDRLDGRRKMVRHLGFDASLASDAVDLLRLDQDVSRTGLGYEQLSQKWKQLEAAPWFKEVYPEGGPRPVDAPERAW
jgi:hypothetical protein